MKIEEYVGKSKKTGNDFRCFKLTIGEWETLIFPRSSFEYKYISEYLKHGR